VYSDRLRVGPARRPAHAASLASQKGRRVCHRPGLPFWATHTFPPAPQPYATTLFLPQAVTMASFFTSIYTWFSALFFAKHAEISVVGLQASGKTSFVNVLGSGQWTEDVIPTVAFNLRKVRKGNVTMKIWDVAGQPKFRTMWERYCNGVDAIVFVVDSTDKEKFETARFELHSLLSNPHLGGVPLLVLGNKSDIDGHASVTEIIQALQLDKIQNRPVSCYSCSMRSQHNLDIVTQWLSERGH